jgi:hypothetical protein
MIWIRNNHMIFPTFTQNTGLYEEATEEKYFLRMALIKWQVPNDDTKCCSNPLAASRTQGNHGRPHRSKNFFITPLPLSRMRTSKRLPWHSESLRHRGSATDYDGA